MMMLVVFDGPNCSGKTTLVNNLYNILKKKHDILITCEPTQDEFGLLLKQNIDKFNPLTYLFLITANRSEHCFNEIIKNNDKLIFCNRYIPSSLALQHHHGIPMDFIWEINKYFPKPDITFFIFSSKSELSDRLNSRENKAFYEQILSREEEIGLYKKAYMYIKDKSHNVYWIENNTDSFQKNIDYIVEIIERNMK